jgi:hypothetical protein
LFTAILTIQGNRDKKTELIHKISFLGLAITTVGVLFKTMIWEGGDQQLTFGLIASGVSLAAILFLRNKPEYENEFSFKTIARLLVFGMTGALLILVSERDIMNFNHKDDPEYVRLFFDMKEHPNNLEAAEKFKTYRLNKQKLEREEMLNKLEKQ